MRYHYKKPDIYLSMYGKLYICNHPVYDRCTLFTIGDKGLAVIQQRFNPDTKTTYQMDVSFPMIFGHRKEFMQSSYSIWSVNELLEYVSSELYPKDNASIAEIEEIVRCFKSMISKYFHMRQDTQLMFSIAINLADNVLDILRAME